MSGVPLSPAFALTRTPVQLARHVSEALGREVYVKRDDQTHPVYGGNKARKLAMLLAEARARGATDLVLVGAAGSNHVLATTVHGRALGFAVTAFVVPRPHSPEAEESLRAAAALGCQLVPTRGEWTAVPRLAHELLRLRLRGRRPWFIPPGELVHGRDGLCARGGPSVPGGGRGGVERMGGQPHGAHVDGPAHTRLFWHSLSSAPLEPLLGSGELPEPQVLALLR